jgi:ubiquitin-protein ligase
MAALNVRSRALHNHFLRTTKDNNPYIRYVATDDIGVWYFMLHSIDGNKGEFKGGEFIGTVMATPAYPNGPPTAKMFTPTGVFPLNNEDFCIDIGKYHANNYPPSLGLDGFTGMIMAGLIGWRELGHGISLFPDSNGKGDVAVITRAAKASRAYNAKHNADIVALFEDAELVGGIGQLSLADAPVPAPVPALVPQAAAPTRAELKKAAAAAAAAERRAAKAANAAPGPVLVPAAAAEKKE